MPRDARCTVTVAGVIGGHIWWPQCAVATKPFDVDVQRRPGSKDSVFAVCSSLLKDGDFSDQPRFVSGSIIFRRETRRENRSKVCERVYDVRDSATLQNLIVKDQDLAEFQD